jgi:isoamylase
LGVPMILMGDEVRRTQLGNNNAYCHDNEVSWFDWTRVDKHANVHRFLRLLIARRSMRDLEAEHRRTSLIELLRHATTAWHGLRLHQQDWGDESHCLAFSVELEKEQLLLHAIFNAYWEAVDFELPAGPVGTQRPWRRWIDTSLDSPQDIVDWKSSPAIAGSAYTAGPRSTVVLFSDM